jgi:hypothetical protein
LNPGSSLAAAVCPWFVPELTFSLSRLRPK